MYYPPDILRARFDANDDQDLLDMLDAQSEARRIGQIDAVLSRGLIREQPESGDTGLVEWVCIALAAAAILFCLYAAAKISIVNTSAQAAEWREWR